MDVSALSQLERPITLMYGVANIPPIPLANSDLVQWVSKKLLLTPQRSDPDSHISRSSWSS